MRIILRKWETNNYRILKLEFNEKVNKFEIWQFGMVQVVIPNSQTHEYDIVEKIKAGDIETIDDGTGQLVVIHNSFWDRLKFFLENKTVSHSYFIDKFEYLPFNFSKNENGSYSAVSNDGKDTFIFQIKS